MRHKHTLLHVTENLIGAAEKWMREDMQKRRDMRINSNVEKLYCDKSDEGVEIGEPDPLQQDSFATPDPSTTLGAGGSDLSTQEEESHAASAVETFREVFMVSALTGDGVPDLKVLFLREEISLSWVVPTKELYIIYRGSSYNILF